MKKVYLAVPVLLTLICSTTVANANTDNSDQVTQQPNVTKIKASRILDLPGGGYKYVYDVSGVENDAYVPPVGFNPLTASAEKLKEYNFPPKPTDPQALVGWENAMSQWKSPQTLPGDLEIENHHFSSQRNWSGYVDNASAGQSFNEAGGNYVQTYWDFTNNPSNAEVSSWVGLGGQSAPLTQTGTHERLSGSSVYIRPFYEYLTSTNYNAEASMPSTIGTIRQGDLMYASVSYDTGTGTTSFFLEDATTGLSAATSISQSQYHSGSSADWIDEDPQYLSSTGAFTYPPLARFDTKQGNVITWSNCDANSSGINASNVTSLWMYGPNSGNLLAYPGSINSSTLGFVDYWVNSQ